MNGLKNYRSSLVGISVAAMLTLASSLYADPVTIIQQTDSSTTTSLNSGARYLDQDFTTGSMVTKLQSVSFLVTGSGTGIIDLQRGVDGSGGYAPGTSGHITAHTSYDAATGYYWLTASFNNVLLNSHTTYDLEAQLLGIDYLTSASPIIFSDTGVTLGNLYNGGFGTGTIIAGQYATFEATGVTVPEPSSMMMLLGTILVGGYAKLKQRNAQSAS